MGLSPFYWLPWNLRWNYKLWWDWCGNSLSACAQVHCKISWLVSIIPFLEVVLMDTISFFWWNVFFAPSYFSFLADYFHVLGSVFSDSSVNLFCVYMLLLLLLLLLLVSLHLLGYISRLWKRKLLSLGGTSYEGLWVLPWGKILWAFHYHFSNFRSSLFIYCRLLAYLALV